jgi:hypothetical protein
MLFPINKEAIMVDSLWKKSPMMRLLIDRFFFITSMRKRLDDKNANSMAEKKAEARMEMRMMIKSTLIVVGLTSSFYRTS